MSLLIGKKETTKVNVTTQAKNDIYDARQLGGSPISTRKKKVLTCFEIQILPI